MTKSNVQFFRGLLFLALAQIMVGVNIVCSKLIVSTIPILFILTIRFTLATVLLLLLHAMKDARRFSISVYFSPLNRRDWFFMIAQGLSAGILFNFLMMLGLHYTDANVAGIITSALPAMIALMSWLMLKEKISGKKWGCVILATLGLVVIAGDKLQGVTLAHSFMGDAIVLLSLIPEATYYVLCKMHRHSLPVFLISAFMNGMNAILLLLLLMFVSWGGFHIQGFDWLILIILGVSSGFFYVFWYFGCQYVDGVMASLSTAIMPVSTVIIAWLMLGERLNGGEALGMGMVLLSIAMYAKR